LLRPLRVAAAAALSLWLAGCGEDGEPAHAIYVVPASIDQLAADHFLDHPFPSDLRLEDGTCGSHCSPRFTGFYNPTSILVVDTYVDATVGLLDGFSPAAPGYVRFDAPLDPASLPADPGATLSPEASVQLIDVDPASPAHGQRMRVSTSFRAAPGRYLLPNTLRFMPALGFPLRPHTRYALVVTDALRAATGGEVLPSDELLEVLGINGPTGPRAALHDAYTPIVDEIGALGVARESIVHFSVFTTGDPSAEAELVARSVHDAVQAPDFIEPWIKYGFMSEGFVEYQADYGPSPNFQRGTLPFKKYGDGGEFNVVDGVPTVVDTFDLRFSLSVPSSPECPMPAEGYPVVLYAHGTGGNFRSYLNEDYAATMAQQCIAMMGVDQIFHGTRPGAPVNPEDVLLLFFNFENPIAARTNGRQSAIDEIQRARLFTETHAVIPASISHTGEDIRFDPTKVMFFGHSQGGLNGPLYLALDDSARGGVLSGSGAIIGLALLEKTAPQPSIAQLVPTVFLGLLPEELEELDLFHPAIMLAQSIVDSIDPINYARLTVREPLPGFVPKSVLITEGLGADGVGDHYTPPHGIEAQAVAMGVPLLLPAQIPIAQLGWGADPAVTVPPDGLRGNLAGGEASGALVQWAPPPDSDGHFVVFDVPQARAQVAAFLRALADDPVGRVPAP
jgi:predicted esterase